MKTTRQLKQDSIKQSLLLRRKRMSNRNPIKSAKFAEDWQRRKDNRKYCKQLLEGN